MLSEKSNNSRLLLAIINKTHHGTHYGNGRSTYSAAGLLGKMSCLVNICITTATGHDFNRIMVEIQTDCLTIEVSLLGVVALWMTFIPSDWGS